MLRELPLLAARALTCAAFAIGSAMAQSGTDAAGSGQVEPLPPDKGWPRQFSDGTATLVVYQPQIDSWKDFQKLEGRFAVLLTPSKGTPPVYGAVKVTTDTSVDKDSRVVAIANFKAEEAKFPAVSDPEKAKAYADLTARLLPKEPTSVALDRILAYLDTTQIKPKQVEVKLEPPTILVSNQPAVLVIVDGEPILYDVENTELQKVVNTNWDLFFDKKDKRYWLRNNRTWLSAKMLTDPWKVEKKTPGDFSKLPDTDEYKEVKASAAAPQTPPTLELILVVNKPSELIVIMGSPALQPVKGTGLQWVSNTECDLFFNPADRNYYFLTSGRWFRTTELRGGKWEAATTSLPEDFKKIPADHPRAHVLAAVPGTRQAEEAVIAASIPQKATIERSSAKADVQYVGGEPKFEPIKGTNVMYAANTPNDVLKIGETYYLCLQGVWLMSTTPKGPWNPADKVPDDIYQIPPESPKYNVTYVEVYDSTPTTVTYGYTSGYMGVYVGYGVAMWGTGWYYPPYYGWGYYPYPVYWPYPYYTYGASAWYNPVTGAYGRGSAVYGPYGGYGRAAAYNPSTGRYSWGRAAWGPYGAAATGGFYNPNTGGWGGRAAVSNGYQTWGRSVVGRGDNWARTASYSDARGTVGAIQGSNGGAAIAGRGQGGSGFVGRSAGGDVYAGRDGNVYKRDQSGNWYRNNGSGGWDNMSRPTPQSGNLGASRTQSVGELNRDAAARNAGNYNANRSAAAASRGNYSGGGFSRGGGGFRGGGRRR
jgi:hypothetical protein